MHPGWAAQAGYRAARLAQAGFTGPRTVFEGEHGFFHAFANSDGCDFDAMLDGAGSAWLCADIAFKPYACGTMAHPYIDCARRLVAEGVRARRRSSRSSARPPKASCTGCGSRSRRSSIRRTATRRSSAFRTRSPSACCAATRAWSTTKRRSCTIPRCARWPAKVRYVIDPDNPYPRQFTGHVRVTLHDGEVREAQPGALSRRRRRAAVGRRPRSEVPRQLRLRRLGRGRARGALWPCCARCAPRRAVDLAALRG